MFKLLILIAGIAFLAFQIFVNQGNNGKFKSDLPTTKKGGKVKCFIILSLISSVALLLILTLLSLIF